jgi:hypothetical protein
MNYSKNAKLNSQTAYLNATSEYYDQLAKIKHNRNKQRWYARREIERQLEAELTKSQPNQR